jgi:hypothetical protein
VALRSTHPGRWRERIVNLYVSLFRPGASPMPEILPIRSRRPVITCFSDPESRNLNYLVMIPFFAACERSGKGSSGNPHHQRRAA